MDLSQLPQILKALRNFENEEITISWDMHQNGPPSIFYVEDKELLLDMKRYNNSWFGTFDKDDAQKAAQRVVAFLVFLDAFGKKVQRIESFQSIIHWKVSKRALIAAFKLLEQSLETFRKVVRAAESPEEFCQLAGVELD